MNVYVGDFFPFGIIWGKKKVGMQITFWKKNQNFCRKQRRRIVNLQIEDNIDTCPGPL